MNILNKAKMAWIILSTVVTILFGIFLGLGAISDNLPKVLNLYKNIFSEKVEFSMNSENNQFFMIKSTLNATYKFTNNFLKINTNEFAIQYQRKPNKPLVQNIGYIRVGVAKYIQPPTKRWAAEIFSQEIHINKSVLSQGSLIIEPKEFMIPIAKIEDLSNYWVVLEVGQLHDNNQSVSTVYAHSKRNIFNDI